MPEPDADLTGDSHGKIEATDGTDLTSLTDNDSKSTTTFESARPTVTWTAKGRPAAVTGYTLTSGSDGSTPTGWTLSGSNDGKHWKRLDSRSRQDFRWDTQTRPFTVAHPKQFRKYRIQITGTNDGKAPTLAELELLH